MEKLSSFKSTPFGSLLLISADKRISYLDEYFSLPESIRKILSSSHTGAYIRGLVKSHNLRDDAAPIIAFVVLSIALGKSSLAKLGANLSAQLKIPNDKSQKIAQEIEKDIFSPIGKEFTTYLRQLKAREAEKKTTTGSPNKQAVQNVVNLKDKHQEIPPPKPNSSKPNEPIF